MAYRNTVCTPQVIDLETEQGHSHIHSESFNRTGNDSSNQGAQHAVRGVGNATNIGLSDMRSYYDVGMNHPHQPVHNLPPNLGVDSGFVFPSSMYNPCMSTTSMNQYVSHTQSFGLPSNQVVLGSMDEGSRNENAGESARGFIKRKNAAVAGSYHCANGFASSSSSHASLNPTHRPWDPSFESNVLPNTASYNPSEYHSQTSWPSMEGSSIPGNGFNLMGAHPESAQHGNYAFPTSHISQCFQPTSNTWISQSANGIADGIPQWEYVNGMNNAPAGRFSRSGMTETVNGSFREYQNGPSTLCRGPLPYFHQHAGMHAHNLLDHTQVQAPYQQCHNNPVLHGVNHSGNRFHLGPRIPVLFSNSERTFGPPHHPLLANPVNHRNIRILPPEHATIMDFSRLYEVSNVVDEHRDMRLDIDSMTYEELLALEEQIGDVNTGLAKSYIVEKLKTSLFVPGSSCMSNKSSESSMENDACIICQEEYQVKECIGTLDCGHRYHEDCIKQWLMVKNLCPICKTTALSTGRRSG
ncbi:probable E3 ubiquitin-protein ligase ZFP1 isoform X1 [Oryza glaberrima]|uniref:probable E3 ubiquitin-protein ligase ZFP1 isoform X1 n=1 Tax=Oryza glaberrima TaxID=4538 RepID=UPI00224C5915|nr:probable E3 ubiquitin-protein ligase ZFP1 isoform X1 [Oryza glaberrima]